jgi:hypothetical protein
MPPYFESIRVRTRHKTKQGQARAASTGGVSRGWWKAVARNPAAEEAEVESMPFTPGKD